MPKIPTWQPLRAGDEVTILAPSIGSLHRIEDDEIGRIAEKFSQWGLKLTMPQDFNGKDYYAWVNRPEQRAQQVIDALKNTKIKVMFLMGGNFAEDVIEILRARRDELQSRNDMVAIGFSDGDQTLHFLGVELGLVTPVEGPPPNRFFFNRDGFKEEEAIKNFLFHQKTEDVVLTCLNDAARSADKIEGKLEVFDSMNRRSSYRPIVDEKYGSILLLEARYGKVESANSLRFALEVMRQQGEKPRAIVLSEVDVPDLAELVVTVRELDIPIFIGAPFGHGLRKTFLPLPLHTDSRIAVNGDGAELSIDAVRSVENIEIAKAVCQSRPRYLAPSPKPVSEASEISDPISLTFVNPTSWVDRVADERMSKEFFLSRAIESHKSREGLGLDGISLVGESLMLELPDSPSFSDWKRRSRPGSDQSEKAYDKERLSAAVQTAGEVLMELKKVEQLPREVAFVSRQELPCEFSEWLRDFSHRHCPDSKFFVGETPKFFRDEFAKYASESGFTKVPRVNVGLQIEQSLHSSSARRA